MFGYRFNGPTFCKLAGVNVLPRVLQELIKAIFTVNPVQIV
tara:strand:- start:348 stop:470 length:123 start_codon:yes stop_codon:yes gene_type:complete